MCNKRKNIIIFDNDLFRSKSTDLHRQDLSYFVLKVTLSIHTICLIQLLEDFNLTFGDLTFNIITEEGHFDCGNKEFCSA